MLWSKSDFFKQSDSELLKKQTQMEYVLIYMGFDTLDILSFYQAYRFFWLNPSKFDGATIVKDLEDIKGLDLSAMLHDYNYIVELPNFKGKDWLRMKLTYDWEYGRNMELLGKGITIPYLRALGLIISTPFYWLYKTIKND